MEARTLTRAEQSRVETIGRDLAKEFTPHWTNVTQLFLDKQRELEKTASKEVAVCAPLFALEIHVAALICSNAQVNARVLAQRVLERVKAHTPAQDETEEA